MKAGQNEKRGVYSHMAGEEPVTECLLSNKKFRGNQIVLLGFFLFVVGVIVVIVHWHCLSARAISYDDTHYLSNNQLVQNPGWTSVRRFFSEVLRPSTVKGYYQPLAMTSLMLDYVMAGDPENLRPFHRTSLALHVMNTLLIIVLLYLLLGHLWAAVAAGLLFGVHPMTVESITWIGDRKTVLATFFALWSLVLYIGYARRGSLKLYVVCALMYVLALLSKPTSTPLPMLLLLFDYWPLRRLKWKAVLEKIPLFLIGSISAVITVASQGSSVYHPPDKSSILQILLTLSHNIVFYLYKILWPANLSSHYPFPEIFSIANPMVLISVIGTIVIITALLISLRWTPVFLVGWLFFFLAIFPTMQILRFSNVIAADKFAYLPSIGFLLAVAWILRWLWGRASAGRVRLRRLVIVLVVVLLAGLEATETRRYLVCWQDSEQLFRHMVSITPHAAQPHCGLGTFLVSQGRRDEAVDEFREALRLDPKDFQAHNNLGVIWSAKGKIEQAIAHYTEALRIASENAEIHNNMGKVLLNQGKLEQALQYFTKAVQIDPQYVDAHNNLGAVLLRKNRLDEAMAEFREVLRLEPEHDRAHNNLGVALLRKDRIDEAIGHFREVLELEPNDYKAHNNIGNALLKKDKTEEAIAEFNKALRLYPDYVNAHSNLARTYFMRGDIDQAVNHWTEVLRIQPGHPDALDNLASTLYRQGRIRQAIVRWTELLQADPNWSAAHDSLATAHYQLGQTTQAITHWREALRFRSDSPAILNNLAWVLATSEKGDFYEPAEAILLAERAAELTGFESPGTLDTLSVAYAAAGRFTKAVQTAEKAFNLARQTGNEDLIKQIRGHLDLFKTEQPFIETRRLPDELGR